MLPLCVRCGGAAAFDSTPVEDDTASLDSSFSCAAFITPELVVPKRLAVWKSLFSTLVRLDVNTHYHECIKG